LTISPLGPLLNQKRVQYGSVFPYFPEKTLLSPPLLREEIESDPLLFPRGGLGWGSLIEPYWKRVEIRLSNYA